MTTRTEQRHMDKVAQLGCIVCMNEGLGETPACIHHAETATSRRNHLRVIPLCWHHHQGPEGIHGMGRKAWQAKYGSEQQLLEQVAQLTGGIDAR